jgi:hypothetical protein
MSIGPCSTSSDFLILLMKLRAEKECLRTTPER